MKSPGFRFYDMDIWQRGAALSPALFEIADQLERRRLRRFSEQLRAATLSITNNIAEGSGSDSPAEFAQFLNIARRSVFEVASMLLLFARQGYCVAREIAPVLEELEQQSRMLLAFRRTLRARA